MAGKAKVRESLWVEGEEEEEGKEQQGEAEVVVK